LPKARLLVVATKAEPRFVRNYGNIAVEFVGLANDRQAQVEGSARRT
jgi:hypothetical protein